MPITDAQTSLLTGGIFDLLVDAIVTQDIWDKLIGNILFNYNRRVVELKNNSGLGVVAGDVVVLDTTADSSFTTTTTANDKHVLGVAQEIIANGVVGKVQISSLVLVNVGSAVASRGMYLSTSAVAKQAQASSAPGTADFAVSVAITGGAGLCLALLLGPMPRSGVYKQLGTPGKTSSNQAITSTVTPGSDLSLLTLTCTPDGVHDVEVVASLPQVSLTGAATASILLRKSVDGGATWTTVNTMELGSGSGFNWLGPGTFVSVDTAPAAGSTIYKLTMFVTTGTGNTIATTATNVLTARQAG